LGNAFAFVQWRRLLLLLQGDGCFTCGRLRAESFSKREDFLEHH
jgi:hypothetical protein